MSICLLVIGQIDLFVLKVSFSVCTSPNIQNETLFLRFKIFLINFGILEVIIIIMALFTSFLFYRQ